MTRLVKHLSLATLLCVAGACSSFGHRCTQFPQTNGQYCLQPIISRDLISMQQKVELNFNDLHETMIVDLEVNAKGLQFIAFTPLGQKLIQINDDNFKITSNNVLPTHLDSMMLVGLLQLALWPSDAVLNGLKAPLIMKEFAQERIFFSNGKIVMSIQYADSFMPHNQLSINMPHINLRLDINQLLITPKENHAQ
tara:strand:- start:124 stop:708 length:585 start_codon:yes stop_codon:yes gene_type:complete